MISMPYFSAISCGISQEESVRIAILLKHAGLDYWHYLDINYYDGLEDFFARNKGPFYYFSQNWMGVMAAVEGMPLAARIFS